MAPWPHQTRACPASSDTGRREGLLYLSCPSRWRGPGGYLQIPRGHLARHHPAMTTAEEDMRQSAAAGWVPGVRQGRMSKPEPQRPRAPSLRSPHPGSAVASPPRAPGHTALGTQLGWGHGAVPSSACPPVGQSLGSSHRGTGGTPQANATRKPRMTGLSKTMSKYVHALKLT